MRFVLIILAGLVCHSAEAAQLAHLSEGNWAGGAYSDDTTGTFSHCVAGTYYKSGLELLVSINRQYEWSLGVGFPSAGLTVGHTAQLQFRIDGGPWLAATASVVMPDLVVLPMSGDSTLISMFRLGHTLEISANQQTLEFDLTSSSRLMVDLAQCVSERLAFESPSSVQPAPDTHAPSTAPAATATNNEASHEPALSSGTGIVISASGDIVTNQHVIDGCKAVLVERPGDLPQTANVLAEDKDVDLAVLRSTNPIVDAAELARIRLGGPMKMGDAIAVFGFPLAGALSSSGNLTSGTITALAGLGDNSSHVQISAPIQPGNSGGPLLDYKGDVIGMVDSKLNEVAWASKTGDLPQNVNFAIKANVLTNFLDAHSITYGVASESDPSLELPAIGDRAKRFTVFILCSR